MIIDIPEELKNKIDNANEDNYKTYIWWFDTTLYCAIKNGIPLDDVKAEIAEEICLTDNPYTKETKYTIEHLKLFEILDNIGKAEGGDKK